MKTVHYVQMALGSLGAGLPGLAAAFPDHMRSYFLMVAASCILVSTTLGVVSDSAVKA